MFRFTFISKTRLENDQAVMLTDTLTFLTNTHGKDSLFKGFPSITPHRKHHTMGHSLQHHRGTQGFTLPTHHQLIILSCQWTPIDQGRITPGTPSSYHKITPSHTPPAYLMQQAELEVFITCMVSCNVRVHSALVPPTHCNQTGNTTKQVIPGYYCRRSCGLTHKTRECAG